MNDEPVSGHNRGVHKYSSHENGSEIDHEKQNKRRVKKKREQRRKLNRVSALLSNARSGF